MGERIRSHITLVVAAIALLISPGARAAGEALHLDLSDPGWELEGEGTVVEEFDGEVALRLMSGKATFRGLGLLDGTIEFDLQVTELRSFAYLYFRMVSDDEHEEIYFRPHKSLLPDAVQYTPVYKGSSQWQLYHDARATAAAHLPAGNWIPIKVVVEGRRAAVFVGAAAEPQLVVPRLAREAGPGFIALRSFMTFGTPPDTYVANFANVVVRPGVVDYEFPQVEVDDRGGSDPGRIERWQVSPAFAPAEGDILELPLDLIESDQWQSVPANADGLVEIERYLTRPEGLRRASVLARLRFTAAEVTTRRLDLGFSDEVSVFLNGRLLVVDDESYSFNLPRRQGLWATDQLSLFLPLRQGVNELIVAVTDRFGGWGLSGRLEATDGVAVEPR